MSGFPPDIGFVFFICALQFIFVCGGFFLHFVHFVVPMGISPMGNLGRFPQGKPAATELRYPTLININVHELVFLCFHNPPKL